MAAEIVERMEEMGIPPAAIARAIAFAIEQPADIDVNEIIVRPLRSRSLDNGLSGNYARPGTCSQRRRCSASSGHWESTHEIMVH